MNDLNILWGVCGIGNGHTYRQLPLIERFVPHSNMVIFAYGEAYKFYAARYARHPKVLVTRVAVPFYVGDKDGLDFAETATHPSNSGVDFIGINAAAMATAQSRLGRPDLVVSDYEPVSAQYAYAKDASLVTIDQQSKYLAGDFPPALGGQGYKNEVALLRMFFPRAAARIACSFFRVPNGANRERVQILPPVIKGSVLNLARSPEPTGRCVLVYLSPQRSFDQSVQEVAEICATQKKAQFHLFAPGHLQDATSKWSNVHLYSQGDSRFYNVLRRCTGIISTAGHTLLSEAMHLGIPVYAMPLGVYEQQMNAHVIAENGFGVSHPRVEEATLRHFLAALHDFHQEIECDRAVLLRGSGEQRILGFLSQSFLGGVDLTR
jgi:uncharacterized protein (TIGR00661 family)